METAFTIQRTTPLGVSCQEIYVPVRGLYNFRIGLLCKGKLWIDGKDIADGDIIVGNSMDGGSIVDAILSGEAVPE